jgi:hypothetical protein
MSTGTEHGWWEWVFSGAGIVFLGGMGRWLYQKFLKPTPQEPPKPEPTRSTSVAVAQNTSTVAVGTGAHASSLAIGAGASVSAPVVVGSNNTQQVTTVQQMHYHAADMALPILELCPSTPTAEEIINSLKCIPDYQKQKMAQDYVGLPVKWPTRFIFMMRDFSASCLPEPTPKDLWRVVVRFGKENIEISIRFVVDVDEYPRFKTMRPETPIWVEGTIEQIDDWRVSLKDCSLSFE